MNLERRLHGLLIGVGQYQHLPRLDKPVTDARDMRDALERAGYAEATFDLLVDQQATRPAIAQALDRLAQRARKDDTAIVFVSGHGGRSVDDARPGEYLYPVEADLGRPDETCISGAELTAGLRAVQAGRLVVFLDVCHAGGLGEPRGASLRTGLTAHLYAGLAGEGRAIIAACRPEELAWEYAHMRNGLFTHYLLEGLRGQAARPDGGVWLSSLFGYVYEQVAGHGHQHPYQKTACEDFVIARAPASATASAARPAAGPAPTALDLSLEQATRLRKAMHQAYDSASFEILLGDLGLDYYDLPGRTLELKMMYLIDRYRRRRQEELLIGRLLSDHPHLANVLA
jgi:uncharacterized caspase-like protein